MLHDQHFPLVTSRFNKNVHKISDFMTTGLLTSRTTKIRLHKLALANNTHDNWTKYRTYRNIFNKTVRASKKFHFVSKLNSYSRNPKKTWDILSKLTTGKSTAAQIDKISIDNKVITDPLSMANEFNKFFSEVGRKIHDSVEPIDKHETS